MRLQEAWRQAPGITEEELSIGVQEGTQILWEPVRAPGERPSYPIRWDSPRQKRAFFASDGFGRGVPSERTGQLEESWQRELRVETGSILGRVWTDLYYAYYTRGGAGQSDIFRGFYEPALRIWGNLREPVEAQITQAVQRAVNRIGGLIK